MKLRSVIAACGLLLAYGSTAHAQHDTGLVLLHEMPEIDRVLVIHGVDQQQPSGLLPLDHTVTVIPLQSLAAPSSVPNADVAIGHIEQWSSPLDSRHEVRDVLELIASSNPNVPVVLQADVDLGTLDSDGLGHLVVQFEDIVWDEVSYYPDLDVRLWIE